MIFLSKDDKVFGSDELKVCLSGNYQDTDLVLVYSSDINSPVYQYQAHYIKYGIDYVDAYQIDLSSLEYNFKLTGTKENPVNLDYNIFGLQKERIIVKGELILTNYHRNYDHQSEQYSDLVLKESRAYTRDLNGLAVFRIQTTEWFLENDSVGLTNSTIKYYSQREAIQEGISRRTNMIDEAKTYCINNLGLNYSFDLLNSLATVINIFKDGYTQPLRDSISASTKVYLTNNMKTDLVTILTI